MAKIFSILTIVVAAAAIYFGLEADKRAADLGKAGAKLKGDLGRTEKVLQSTREELATTQAKLAETEKEFNTTKETLRTTETKLKSVEDEYAKAKAELESAKSSLAEISTVLTELFPDKKIDPKDLKQTIAEMKTTVTELATAKKTLEEQAKALEGKVAELTADKENLTVVKDQNEKVISSQGGKLKEYEQNIMVKGIRGRVLAVNHGWGFCVLSIGDKAGAAANKVLIVSRGGQAIGRVKITNVEQNQSVADILTGSFIRGTMVEPGDTVIYTGDDKAKIESDEAPVTPPASTPTTTTPSALPELPQR